MQIILLLINKCVLYNVAVFWEYTSNGDYFTDSVGFSLFEISKKPKMVLCGVRCGRLMSLFR